MGMTVVKSHRFKTANIGRPIPANYNSTQFTKAFTAVREIEKHERRGNIMVTTWSTVDYASVTSHNQL